MKKKVHKRWAEKVWPQIYRLVHCLYLGIRLKLYGENFRPTGNSVVNFTYFISVPCTVVRVLWLAACWRSQKRSVWSVPGSDWLLSVYGRRSLWLSRALTFCLAQEKLVINAALGFDTFLVMRHGVRRKEDIGRPPDAKGTVFHILLPYITPLLNSCPLFMLSWAG
jgi:hypothetical protein